MGTIGRAQGSIHRAIRIKRKRIIVHNEAQTFGHRVGAAAWLKKREPNQLRPAQWNAAMIRCWPMLSSVTPAQSPKNEPFKSTIPQTDKSK